MRTTMWSSVRKIPGFSLVELLVVLSIAAILVGMAVPAFGNLVESHRIATAVNEFAAAIQLTRSEAIQRGRRVDLVPAGTGWKEGWVVFVDDNENQAVDPGESIVYRHGPVSTAMSVTSSLSDPSPLYLAYNGTGRTRTNLAGGQQPQFGNFTFSLGAQKRKIIINYLGRPLVCTPTPGVSTC